MIRKAWPVLVVAAVAGMALVLSIALVAAEVTATRSLPEGPVAPGDVFSVTISNIGFGSSGIGQVVETLPAGFSYVEHSVSGDTPDAVIDGEASDQTVIFAFVGVDSFTYMVTVGPDVEDGQYQFSGELQGFGDGEPFFGDDEITVLSETTATPEGISRSLPGSAVAPGDEFSVTINNVDRANALGEVVETLPAGFSYVVDSASSDTPNAVIDGVASGQTVTFTFVAVDSFTYMVAVGQDVAGGQHSFSGVLTNLDDGDEAIAGDSIVTVEAESATTPGGISRSLPGSSVARGGEFSVTINNVDRAKGFGGGGGDAACRV